MLFPLLQKKKYGRFIAGMLATLILNCVVSFFLYNLIRPLICPNCGPITFQEKINMPVIIGINVAGILGVVALGIKFTIHWYLQQMQNRILAKQKLSSELKLLKARIQPGFLFESLQEIDHKLSVNKNLAADMLLKFSDLLSYMLYECNEDFVLLQRELTITNEFIGLEKIVRAKSLSINCNIMSHADDKYIPSFIILPLVQNCIINLHNDLHKQPHQIEIEIHTENNFLYCHINCYPADAARSAYTAILNTIRNRLEISYSNNYELKSLEENGKFIIIMSLLLLNNLPAGMISASETRFVYDHI